MDKHRTPLGWIRGLEVLARITESDRENTPPATTTVLKTITVGGLPDRDLLPRTERHRAVIVAVSGMAIGFLAAWWSTHLTRNAILVEIVFMGVPLEARLRKGGASITLKYRQRCPASPSSLSMIHLSI